MKLFRHTMLTFAFLVFAVSVRAEDRKLIEKKRADKEPATEQEFLVKAIADDIAEIKLAELAVKKSKSKDVERFARKMIDDHRKNRDMLLARAKVLKLGVVEGLEKEHKERMARLSKLEGDAFDREYMHCMVEDHEQDVKMYETWSKKVKDSDFSDNLAKTAKTVKEHLTMAKEIHDKVK